MANNCVFYERIKMIYFITAFFLALNDANEFWWGSFICITLIEFIIFLIKLDITLNRKSRIFR